jgi:hypothetical protein
MEIPFFGKTLLLIEDNSSSRLSNKSFLMKSKITLTVALSCILLGGANASITMNLGLGELTDSAAADLPNDTLWALISENTSGDLPGGFGADSSIYSNTNPSTIENDFAGQTISVGAFIGGGEVVAIGSTSGSPTAIIASSPNFNLGDFTNLNAGDKLGVYWFPGRTTISNTIPSSGTFEVGGFHRTLSNANSGGNAGLVVPSDGANVSTFYYDNTLTGDASGISSTEFQAVAVPEPSTLFLLGLSALHFIRRRR